MKIQKQNAIARKGAPVALINFQQRRRQTTSHVASWKRAEKVR